VLAILSVLAIDLRFSLRPSKKVHTITHTHILPPEKVAKLASGPLARRAGQLGALMPGSSQSS
jgi:hypothetical protein